LGQWSLAVPTRKLKKYLKRIILEHTCEIHELQLISLLQKNKVQSIVFRNSSYNKAMLNSLPSSRTNLTTKQFLSLPQTYEVLFRHKIHGGMDETESPNLENNFYNFRINPQNMGFSSIWADLSYISTHIF
jgi:hypothetical protein